MSFLNSKQTPIAVTRDMLPPNARLKGHGFVTFRDPKNPKQRWWGRLTNRDGVIRRFITKAEAEELPTPLPPMLQTEQQKSGAVTRTVLVGDGRLIPAN